MIFFFPNVCKEHKTRNMDDKASESLKVASSISAATVKLPAFWSSQPKVWFAQAECQFLLRGMSTDETRYHHLVASLDQDSARRVVDIISNPAKENKYKLLKDRLLATFSMSPYCMCQKLVNMAPLGDRSPLELMDDMLALVGDHAPCMIFRTIFVDLLPPNTRPHLLPVMESLPPRDLALLADQLVSSERASIQMMRKKINESKRDESMTPKDWCRLHRKWGSKAYCCESPCAFGRSGARQVNAVQGNFNDDHQ